MIREHLPTDRIASLVERHRANVERAEKMLADRDPTPLIPDVMTPDHPLARAFGFEQAAAMFDTASRRRDILAKKRRADVERLSRAGKLVREIAAELGLSYSYVVALRMSLSVGRRR